MQEILKEFKSNDPFKYLKHFQSKYWIYQNETIVLDFKDEEFKFAFDITQNQHSNKLNVELVLRDNATQIFFSEIYPQEKNFIKEIDLRELQVTLLQVMQKLLEKISATYAYRISVVIPVYNRAKLIIPLLESLKQQTLDKNKFEVIFVDDGSTDNSLKVINDYLSDSQVHFQTLKRASNSGGACAPRNDGIMAAKGEYIFFVDSDDYILDDCLANLLVMAEKNYSDIVYVKLGTDDSNRKIAKRPYKKGNVDDATFWENHLTRSVMIFKLFRSSMIKRNHIYFDYGIKVGEDILFMFKALSYARKISILADKAYVIMTSHENGHLSKVKKSLHDYYLIFGLSLFYVYSSSFPSEYKREFYSCMMNFFIEFLRNTVMPSKAYSQKEKREYFEKIYQITHSGGITTDFEKIMPDTKLFFSLYEQGNFDGFLDASILFSQANKVLVEKANK